MAVVERIFTHPPGGGPRIEQQGVRVIAGAGIEGDKHFDLHDEPGRNVTLIEAEELEAFLTEHGRPHDLSVTGRNVVTRGIRLNDLVGVEFLIGRVRFRGVELCEPCGTLGRALAGEGLPPAAVVKRLLHRAGLRADVLSDGEISVGAAIERVRGGIS